MKKYSDSKEELINDVEINLKKGENNEKPGLNKNKNNHPQDKIIFNIDKVQNKLKI